MVIMCVCVSVSVRLALPYFLRRDRHLASLREAYASWSDFVFGVVSLSTSLRFFFFFDGLIGLG